MLIRPTNNFVMGCSKTTALDSDFTKRIPNQRPEQCPRSFTSHASSSLSSFSGGDETMGYRRGMNVLTVGDGDFTFSLAVARHVICEDEKAKNQGMVVATSYEDTQTLRNVYPDFDNTLEALLNNSHGKRSDNVIIGYNVDATRLDETLPKQIIQHTTKSNKGNMKFHRICWNFPCTAIGGGQDGQNDAIEENKELVRKFVANALPYLTEDGEIHMCHKTKPPYNQWGLEKVALQGTGVHNGFEFKGRIVFDKCTLPPYTPRKALDRKSFPCHDACFFVFGWSKSSLHSTIPENNREQLPDLRLPNPASIIPVTETVLEKVRSVHLSQSGDGKGSTKKQKQKKNGTRNKRRKKC